MVAFAGYPLMVGERVVGVMVLFAKHRLSDDVLVLMESVANTIAVGIARKRSEAELHKTEEQLRQAQKLEAIGSLAGGVAHDFNNLLTIINGYSEIIGSQLPADSPVRDLVREIGQAGERAASLTRQLLAFSRKQVLEPKVFNLNAIVTDTAKMLRRLIGEDIELNTTLEPGLRRVRADPGQLEQVLINLAVNARDAMPQGGKLTIETANAELHETYTHAYADLPPGPYVMMAVSDTGCGMDEATKARIFEPFFTTKGPGKGTGLGLATVYGIVKQSEGHVAVYSEPGRGTTFKIYLPVAEERVPSGKSHPGLQPARPGTETILLAEDEPALQALARHVLQSHGYTVLEAGQGDKALRIAQDYKGTIHLLVTDVVMPAMSGRQLAERLAANRPGVKVLYLSGYTDDAVVRHGVLQAETAFLQKPFTPGALAQKVREVLDS
jgi:signal transduction histidine kinase